MTAHQDLLQHMSADCFASQFGFVIFYHRATKQGVSSFAGFVHSMSIFLVFMGLRD
jgi:hypothetical protein